MLTKFVLARLVLPLVVTLTFFGSVPVYLYAFTNVFPVASMFSTIAVTLITLVLWGITVRKINREVFETLTQTVVDEVTSSKYHLYGVYSFSSLKTFQKFQVAKTWFSLTELEKECFLQILDGKDVSFETFTQTRSNVKKVFENEKFNKHENVKTKTFRHGVKGTARFVVHPLIFTGIILTSLHLVTTLAWFDTYRTPVAQGEVRASEGSALVVEEPDGTLYAMDYSNATNRPMDGSQVTLYHFDSNTFSLSDRKIDESLVVLLLALIATLVINAAIYLPGERLYERFVAKSYRLN